jgi:hypothetical protein
MLNAVILNVIGFYALCLYAGFILPSIIVLNAIFLKTVMLNAILLNVIILSDVVLNVIMLNSVVLNVIILSADKINVVMLSVITPKNVPVFPTHVVKVVFSICPKVFSKLSPKIINCYSI